jgi:DNA repair protein RecO (recombination protein O)
MLPIFEKYYKLEDLKHSTVGGVGHMTHKTKGIVLRTIKYGETSLVVTLFTELFGIQTYMVNGVRSAKKGVAKANYFQPAAILDMVVYHNENKPMHRIKEFGWACLYNTVLTDVIKNSVAAYMVELLQKSLKQPEANADLFAFCEAALLQLDSCNKKVTANFPLFFALHLAYFLGFRITDNYTAENTITDLREGIFIDHQPVHPYFISGEAALLTSQLLKVMQPYELEDFKLHHTTRRQLLLHYQDYYALHISEFGQMKTLTVLHEVL